MLVSVLRSGDLEGRVDSLVVLFGHQAAIWKDEVLLTVGLLLVFFLGMLTLLTLLGLLRLLVLLLKLWLLLLLLGLLWLLWLFSGWLLNSFASVRELWNNLHVWTVWSHELCLLELSNLWLWLYDLWLHNLWLHILWLGHLSLWWLSPDGVAALLVEGLNPTTPWLWLWLWSLSLYLWLLQVSCLLNMMLLGWVAMGNMLSCWMLWSVVLLSKVHIWDDLLGQVLISMLLWEVELLSQVSMHWVMLGIVMPWCICMWHVLWLWNHKRLLILYWLSMEFLLKEGWHLVLKVLMMVGETASSEWLNILTIKWLEVNLETWAILRVITFIRV